MSLTWPSTWADRVADERTPSIPARTGGVVYRRRLWHDGWSVGQRVFRPHGWYQRGTLAEDVAVEARKLAPLPGDVDFKRGAALVMPGLTAWQGLVEHGPPSCGAERPRAWFGRRSRFDGNQLAREAVRTSSALGAMPASEGLTSTRRSSSTSDNDAGRCRWESIGFRCPRRRHSHEAVRRPASRGGTLRDHNRPTSPAVAAPPLLPMRDFVVCTRSRPIE